MAAFFRLFQKSEKCQNLYYPLKEDSAASEPLFYTWKNQSAQTDPMTSELETDSLRAPIDLLMDDIKIVS